jgi:hypothetical protein
MNSVDDSAKNIANNPSGNRYGVARRALPYVLLCALLFSLAVGLSFAAVAKESLPAIESIPVLSQPLVGAEFA